jgi:hypothetical protein
VNSHPRVAKISIQYEGSHGFEGEILSAIETSFRPLLSRLADKQSSSIAETEENPEHVADQLVRIVINFSRIAAAGTLDPKAVDGMRTRIFEFVKRNMPVEAQMLWSPKKHWILGAESAVDLAELAAFQTLTSIDSAVRCVYRAGMCFVIDLEDIEFLFMEGQTEEIVTAHDSYAFGMRSLINALGLNGLFTLRRMSERAKDMEELRRWREQMAENYEALKAYWHDSERSPELSWEKLGTFREIRRLGWRGTIPPEMRAYYMSRLEKVTNTSDREKADMVLRNLAGILFHHQFDLLRGFGKLSPIKLSFVRSADGAPAELLHGRVDLRFAPRKLCSRVSAAAPWATKGFVRAGENNTRVSFRGWHELDGERFAEGRLSIAGSDGASVIRSDFLRRG